MTIPHWVDFYGVQPVSRIRGVCVKVWGGPVVAVGGIAMEGDGVRVFMDMKPEAKAYPRQLVEGGRQVIALARRSRLPVYALQDTEIESSARFLTHLGFEPLGVENLWRLTWQD